MDEDVASVLEQISKRQQDVIAEQGPSPFYLALCTTALVGHAIETIGQMLTATPGLTDSLRRAALLGIKASLETLLEVEKDG